MLKILLLAPMLVLFAIFAAIVYFDVVETRSRWGSYLEL